MQADRHGGQEGSLAVDHASSCRGGDAEAALHTTCADAKRACAFGTGGAFVTHRAVLERPAANLGLSNC